MSRAAPASSCLLISSKRQGFPSRILIHFPCGCCFGPTGRPTFWVLIVYLPLKCHVTQAGVSTSPGVGVHRAVKIPLKQGDLDFMHSPQSLQLVGKLQKVWTGRSRSPRCWREGKVVRGRELCPPSSSKNITSHLNNPSFILLLGSPRLGRGENLETPGTKGAWAHFLAVVKGDLGHEAVVHQGEHKRAVRDCSCKEAHYSEFKA